VHRLDGSLRERGLNVVTVARHVLVKERHRRTGVDVAAPPRRPPQSRRRSPGWSRRQSQIHQRAALNRCRCCYTRARGETRGRIDELANKAADAPRRPSFSIVALPPKERRSTSRTRCFPAIALTLYFTSSLFVSLQPRHVALADVRTDDSTGRRRSTILSGRRSHRVGARVRPDPLDAKKFQCLPRPLTTMTILTIEGAMHEDTWTVAEAKAKLSEVIALAQERGPQTITRNGQTAVVVVRRGVARKPSASAISRILRDVAAS